jgi:hypothetical protein
LGACQDDPERGREVLTAGDEAAVSSGDAWTRAFVSACGSIFSVLVGELEARLDGDPRRPTVRAPRGPDGESPACRGFPRRSRDALAARARRGSAGVSAR